MLCSKRWWSRNSRRWPSEALYAHLHERGLLSSGRAAKLLGITRWEFLDLLGRHGISYFDEDLDLDEPSGNVQP